METYNLQHSGAEIDACIDDVDAAKGTSASLAAAMTAESTARADADAALQTAVDGKASVSDIYGIGTAIELNSDLNDIVDAGVYYSDGSGTSGSLDNCPHKASGFQLFVYLPYGVNIHQILYPISAGGNGLYYKRIKTTGGWQAWTKFSSYGMGTEIADNTDLDTINVPGMYYFKSPTTVTGLSHCPVSTIFHMEVKCTTASTRLLQEITVAAAASAPTTYKRLYTSGGWSSWYKFEGTVVT